MCECLDVCLCVSLCMHVLYVSLCVCCRCVSVFMCSPAPQKLVSGRSPVRGAGSRPTYLARAPKADWASAGDLNAAVVRPGAGTRSDSGGRAALPSGSYDDEKPN